MSGGKAPNFGAGDGGGSDNLRGGAPLDDVADNRRAAGADMLEAGGAAAFSKMRSTYSVRRLRLRQLLDHVQ